MNYPTVVLMLVVLVAGSSLVLFLNDGIEGYQTYGTRPRTQQPQIPMECNQIGVELHELIVEIQEEVDEYNDVWMDIKQINQQLQGVSIAMGSMKARGLMNMSNQTRYNGSLVTLGWLHKRQWELREQLTIMTVETEKYESRILDMFIEAYDLQASITECFFTLMCPPCPERPPQARAECSYLNMKLKERLQSMEGTFVDIKMTWEKWEGAWYDAMLKTEDSIVAWLSIQQVINKTHLAQPLVYQNLSNLNISRETYNSALNVTNKSIQVLGAWVRTQTKDIHKFVENLEQDVWEYTDSFVDMFEKYVEVEVEMLRCVIRECPPCEQATGTRPREQVTTGQPVSRNCEDLCAEKGYSSTEPDFSQYILNYLSEYRCVSGARIQMRRAQIGDCTCYDKNPPQISVDTTTPYCRGTPCGDVKCGSSAQCSCGENCVMTVNCKWQGWKITSKNQPQAVVGASQG